MLYFAYIYADCISSNSNGNYTSVCLHAAGFFCIACTPSRTKNSLIYCQIWLIVVAVWVFLGPYAVTLIIRKDAVGMVCGPLFLLMTPVMFLFMKFYALANFGGISPFILLRPRLFILF